MPRTLANPLLSLLLLTTLLWGGCVSCEQFFMLPGMKTCCAPSGHCKTKLPAAPKSGTQCQQIAFEHHPSLDLHINLPANATADFEVPVICEKPSSYWLGVNTPDPSPPDLQILHSTFLI